MPSDDRRAAAGGSAGPIPRSLRSLQPTLIAAIRNRARFPLHHHIEERVCLPASSCRRSALFTNRAWCWHNATLISSGADSPTVLAPLAEDRLFGPCLRLSERCASPRRWREPIIGTRTTAVGKLSSLAGRQAGRQAVTPTTAEHHVATAANAHRAAMESALQPPSPDDVDAAASQSIATPDGQLKRKRQPRNSACQACAALKVCTIHRIEERPSLIRRQMKCIATPTGRCER